MGKIKFWVLRDSITEKYYVDAGLYLGDNVNDAVKLTTLNSVKDGISKRKRMLKHDLEIGKEYNRMDYEYYSTVKKRIDLGGNFGIQVVEFEIDESQGKLIGG